MGALFSSEEWKALVAALRLSPRKAAIANLLLQDRKDAAIARALGLSKPTVRTHLRQMFSRFRVASRLGLVVRIFVTYRAVIEGRRHHQK